MQVIIRADASEKIGTGHLMRSLALGQVLSERSHSVVFLSNQLGAPLKKRIEKEGFEVVSDERIEPGTEYDAKFTIECLRKYSTNLLILDGYQFNSHFQSLLKNHVARILYIDDSGDSSKTCANIILNQNLWAKKSMYKELRNSPVLLIGPSFILFRKEFRSLESAGKKVNPEVKRILVTAGGSDPGNITPRIIQAIQLLNSADIEVRILLGAQNQKREFLNLEVAKSKFSIKIYESVNDMPPLLKWADLAISGGGFTSFELALMMVPSLLFIESEFQAPNVRELDSMGLAYNLGNSNQCSDQSIFEGLNTMINNYQLRRSMSEKCGKVFDTLGPRRVAEALIS